MNVIGQLITVISRYGDYFPVIMIIIPSVRVPQTYDTHFAAPRVFSIAFNVVKRFLNDYTLGKIQIFKSDPKKWKPAILSNISPQNLPKHYGGELTDPDGNPKYTTVVRD